MFAGMIISHDPDPLMVMIVSLLNIDYMNPDLLSIRHQLLLHILRVYHKTHILCGSSVVRL